MGMDELIQKAMAEQHIPGLAVGIQRGVDVLYEGYHGFANLEHNVPVREDTVFEIASVTKLFTAQAIMRLAQDDKLRLDDSIKRYLPDMPEAWSAVTIRHCLAHQSGIPSYTAVKCYWEITRWSKTPAEVIDLVRDMPLKFEPGTRNAYDNTGFYLLGLVIEAVTQQRYGDYLRTLIFEPLGMSHAQENRYDTVIPHRAQGYIYKDDRMVNKDFYDTSNTFSGGILLSSVNDLLRWRNSMFNDTILNEASRELWWTLHPSQSGNEREFGYTVALGWFLVDSEAGQFWGHNGSIQGFVSSFMYFPNTDITAVVLCNAGHVGEPHKIGFEMMRALGVI